MKVNGVSLSIMCGFEWLRNGFIDIRKFGNSLVMVGYMFAKKGRKE